MSKKRRASTVNATRIPSQQKEAERRIKYWLENRWKQVRRLDLDLSGLGIKELPESLRECRGLRFLYAHGNDLSSLPSWIGRLSSLRGLGLNNNNLQRLPAELRMLSKLQKMGLANNQLRALPDGLLDLPLSLLNLAGNPRLGIPESVLAAAEDPQSILRFYYESRFEEGAPLGELKVLLVGRGKAGKTTLVKRLRGESPNRNEPETHSIEIREIGLDCRLGVVRGRAWDFGGQEILHSTHQFFLTERSLYLVVLEPRTGSADRDAEYWLKLIEAQGGGSPTLVVLNYSRDDDWAVDHVKLKREYPFIVDFVSTDALHGDGVETLRKAMVNAVEDKMPEVWLPFPKRWREIKDAVAGMSESFLTFHQFRKLCAEYGEEDEGAQADLASILHALGLALYFGRDPGLSDTRVLNPRWVTGGVYAVIRSPYVRRRHGQLTVRNMHKVLKEAEAQTIVKVADYPSETRRFILELMRAFQLCYASEVEPAVDGVPAQPARYLVPELLPKYEPEMALAWGEAPVRLRYRYEVLPPGLLPRFIVRTHALSEGAPHWRGGVVLQHGDASALIRAESDRELGVFVLGDDLEARGVLVAMVRQELEALHSEMRTQPYEDIALSGEEEYWISVKALRQVEGPARQKVRLPVLPEGTAEVNVRRELDKLMPATTRAADRDPRKAPLPVRLFVSYAHEDERRLKRLDAMLGVLERQNGLAAWRDRRLVAGERWTEEIRRRLEEMDIFLFVASQFSLASDYIRNTEIVRAAARRKRGEVEIVVAKLEPCASDEDVFLGKFQRLAPGFESIGQKSSAWEQARKDLLAVIAGVRKKRTNRP